MSETNERGEKSFARLMDKTATLHLPTPAYHWNTVPPRTVNPADQRAWYDNPVLCAKRDLNQMSVHSRMNINGHIVTRHAATARHPYTVDGVGCTYASALQIVMEAA